MKDLIKFEIPGVKLIIDDSLFCTLRNSHCHFLHIKAVAHSFVLVDLNILRGEVSSGAASNQNLNCLFDHLLKLFIISMESTGLTKENVAAFIEEKWPSIFKSLEGRVSGS